MAETGLRAPEPPRWQAIAVLLFGACVIGLSPILVRLTETGPAAAGFWRLAFALPLLLHVLGHEHPEDDGRTASRMWRRQEELLARVYPTSKRADPAARPSARKASRKR